MRELGRTGCIYGKWKQLLYQMIYTDTVSDRYVLPESVKTRWSRTGFILMSKVVFISVYIFKFFIEGEHEKERQFSEVVVMEYVHSKM